MQLYKHTACDDTHLFLQAKVTFGYGRVVHFSLMHQSYGYAVEDRSDCVWYQSSCDSAQHIHHSVIMSFLVFQFEFEPCKGSNLLASSGIKVRCCHYLGQWVIVCLYQERLIEQVLLEIFCHCPFQHQKLKCSQLAVLLMRH